MMPRELIDRAKALVREKTGIPTDRILVSATHTHSAPAAMGALGCSADENYVELLPGLIADVGHTRDSSISSRRESAGRRPTTTDIHSAGVLSDVQTRCSTIHSASARSEPTCTPDMRTRM